jgi:hypothetical protein
MPSQKDLEEYEKEYLKRHEEQKKENGKEQTIKKAEEENEEKNEVSKLLKTLDYADYTILESQRTSNVLSCLHLGFEKILDAEEKLFRCGLIEKLKRKLTFSEKEKLERRKDTPQFKQYQARIQRIMDSEMKERIRDHMTQLGLKTGEESFDLTEEGKKILAKKRKELESVWAELKSSYEKGNKQVFRKKLDQNKSMFPLFMVMGLVNGAMMGAMMGKMDMNFAMYMQGMNEMYDTGFTDAGGVIEGGDVADAGGEGGDVAGGGEGGFMDGGTQVGF